MLCSSEAQPNQGRGYLRRSVPPSSRPRSSAGLTSRNRQTFPPASARRLLSLPPAWEQPISQHLQAGSERDRIAPVPTTSSPWGAAQVFDYNSPSVASVKGDIAK